MAKSFDNLNELVHEAIPIVQDGVVNFRALRDLLSASIDIHGSRKTTTKTAADRLFIVATMLKRYQVPYHKSMRRAIAKRKLKSPQTINQQKK